MVASCRCFPTDMRCSNLHLPNAMIDLRFKKLTVISAYRRTTYTRWIWGSGSFWLGASTCIHDAVIALLWEGQPNIMGPGRIRELFSDPVRLYSLFIFLLRLPYHPSAAVSQQVHREIDYENLNWSEWKIIHILSCYGWFNIIAVSMKHSIRVPVALHPVHGCGDKG